jgi:hypothetical protein
MRLVLLVFFAGGCTAFSRVAVGPVFDTRGAVGALLAVSGGFGPSFETSQGRSVVGPTAGVEVGGTSHAPYAALGFHLGIDSLHAVAGEKWAIGFGARLSTSLALPPAAYVGRFSVLLDVGRRLRERDCAPYLGVGVEGGASFGGVPVTTSFGVMWVARWLCQPAID